MFYRTVGLEISAHKNTSGGVLTKSEDPYRGTSPVMFLTGLFFYLCIGWHAIRRKKVELGLKSCFLKAWL